MERALGEGDPAARSLPRWPGQLLAFVIILAITWIIARRSPSRVNWIFRRGQIVSGSFVAFTHGTNDAQKTMGIIALALVASGELEADFSRPPTWVIVSAALAMAAGTYAGGWRIIRTMGTRIAKIDPPQGFAAQTSLRDHPLDDRALRPSGLDDPDDLRLGGRRRLDPRPLARCVGASPETSSSPGR